MYRKKYKIEVKINEKTFDNINKKHYGEIQMLRYMNFLHCIPTIFDKVRLTHSMQRIQLMQLKVLKATRQYLSSLDLSTNARDFILHLRRLGE